jgi:hypothetical protein
MVVLPHTCLQKIHKFLLIKGMGTLQIVFPESRWSRHIVQSLMHVCSAE